jgi:hypothetical protein
MQWNSLFKTRAEYQKHFSLIQRNSLFGGPIFISCLQQVLERAKIVKTTCIFSDSQPDINLIPVCHVVDVLVLSEAVDDDQVRVLVLTYGKSILVVARISVVTLHFWKKIR